MGEEFDYYDVRTGTMSGSVLTGHSSTCPWCLKVNEPKIVAMRRYDEIYYQRGFRKMDVSMSCAGCRQFYIGKFESLEDNRSQWRLLRTYPGTSENSKFDETVRSFSPQFERIFLQAEGAHAEGWDEIAGPGYRKALEFLVKDFAIKNNPDKEEEIKKSFLGKVIDKYLEDNKVKRAAKRAAWLGNDETHYFRKWTDHDINDLKALIKLTVLWIESEAIMEQYESELPDAKEQV